MKKQLWLAARIILFLLAVWYIGRSLDTAVLLAVITESNPWFIVLAVVSVVVSHLLRGERLWLILRAVKVKTTFWRATSVYAISAFWGRITPGKLGELGKIGYFTNKKKVFPYVVLEKIMDVVAVIILAAPLSWIVHPVLPYVIWGGVVLFLALSCWRPFLRSAKELLSRFVALPKSSGMLMLKLFGITFVSWVASLLALYFVARASTLFDPLLFLAAAGLAVVVGIVSGVPGGFGTREATLAYLLTVISGVTLAQGTSIALYAIVVVTLTEFTLFLIGTAGEKVLR